MCLLEFWFFVTVRGDLTDNGITFSTTISKIGKNGKMELFGDSVQKAKMLNLFLVRLSRKPFTIGQLYNLAKAVGKEATKQFVDIPLNRKITKAFSALVKTFICQSPR